ncbi:hypothetical protein [Parasphingopyxis sp.]|uniref:hypothetical protein n=1 Tax=Parasphingopyxis sp. TaxID=1920299 RepID=UPI003F9EF1F5
MDQMHLTQIGLIQVFRHARAMLYSRPEMRIVLHAMTGNQADDIDVRFGNAVGPLSRDGEDLHRLRSGGHIRACINSA